jgi:hypothetical protein
LTSLYRFTYAPYNDRVLAGSRDRYSFRHSNVSRDFLWETQAYRTAEEQYTAQRCVTLFNLHAAL